MLGVRFRSARLGPRIRTPSARHPPPTSPIVLRCGLRFRTDVVQKGLQKGALLVDNRLERLPNGMPSASSSNNQRYSQCRHSLSTGPRRRVERQHATRGMGHVSCPRVDTLGQRRGATHSHVEATKSASTGANPPPYQAELAGSASPASDRPGLPLATACAYCARQADWRVPDMSRYAPLRATTRSNLDPRLEEVRSGG